MKEMKTTGIIRYIDKLGGVELGKVVIVVIPKEIRKSLRIKEGDQLEILTSRDGEIIIKKHDGSHDTENWVEDIMEKHGSEIRGVHVNGKTITVYTSDGAFKATCANSDEFKFNVGVAVALARAYDEELPTQLER